MSDKPQELIVIGKTHEIAQLLVHARDIIDRVEDAIRAIEKLTEGKSTPREAIRQLREDIQNARRGMPKKGKDEGYLGLHDARTAIEEIRVSLMTIIGDSTMLPDSHDNGKEG